MMANYQQKETVTNANFNPSLQVALIVLYCISIVAITVAAFSLTGCTSGSTLENLNAVSTETSPVINGASGLDVSDAKEALTEVNEELEKMEARSSSTTQASPAGSSASNQSAARQRPATTGIPLEELTYSPAHTVGMVTISAESQNQTYAATIEPYGYRGMTEDGVPNELIVRITDWRPQQQQTPDALDLSGSNAVLTLDVPPAEGKQLLVGGSFDVEVRVVSRGGAGALSIFAVK